MLERIFRYAWIFGTLIAQAAEAAPESWTDAASGREYLRLEGAMTWEDAESACLSQGFALFDTRFVEAAEVKALFDGPLFQALDWQVQYPGTTREGRMARVWQSRLGGVKVSSEYGAAQLVIHERQGRRATAIEWHGTASGQAEAVCMATNDFWYRCTVDQRCVYRDAQGEYGITSAFIDFGTTESEAMRRIVERTQDPNRVDGSECSLRLETQICLRLLP